LFQTNHSCPKKAERECVIFCYSNHILYIIMLFQLCPPFYCVTFSLSPLLVLTAYKIMILCLKVDLKCMIVSNCNYYSINLN
jgi:hypothetical protein